MGISLIADVARRAIGLHRRRWQRSDDVLKILLLLGLLLGQRGLVVLYHLAENCRLLGLRCDGSVLSHLRELHAALDISWRSGLCSVVGAAVGICCICGGNLSLHSGLAFLLRNTAHAEKCKAESKEKPHVTLPGQGTPPSAFQTGTVTIRFAGERVNQESGAQAPQSQRSSFGSFTFYQHSEHLFSSAVGGHRPYWQEPVLPVGE